MAVIFRKGNFAVEAVIVNGRPVFRVCEYSRTESTVLDTFESLGFQSARRNAIAQCERRAKS